MFLFAILKHLFFYVTLRSFYSVPPQSELYYLIKVASNVYINFGKNDILINILSKDIYWVPTLWQALGI